MPNVHETWTVLPHGPLTEIEDGILTVTGQIHMPLVEFERRMTVVRLRDGSTIIYSAIALGDAEMNRIEAFGPPRYLIVPGATHRLDAKIFKQRYPDLKVITPPAALDRVEKAVAVDATDADFGDSDVAWREVAGAGGHEAALFVHRASGTTLVLSDLIANLRQKSGFEGWLLHAMGFAGEGAQIPIYEKLSVVENKTRLRQQLLDWAGIYDLKRIIVSHGEPIAIDPAGALRAVAETLQ